MTERIEETRGEFLVRDLKGQLKEKKMEHIKSNRKLAGLIGVGAAGGNVCHVLYGSQYDTAALNTTMADMSDISVDVKIPMDDINGSGKDRSFSATEFKKSYNHFFNHEGIQKLIKNDIIFVIGSGGGGTGTIVSIMVAGFLKNEYPNKTIILIGILGSIKEDLISQINMKEFLSDLETKSSGCPYMLFDNNRVKNKVGDDVFDSVNQDIANSIQLVSKEYFVENARSNIDGRDYARLTSFKGLMSVVNIDKLNISVTEDKVDIASRVKTAMDKSTAIVTNDPDAYGFFMNSKQETYTMVDTTFEEIQNMIGWPTSGLVFKHLQNSTEIGPEYGIIMTGMEAPIERFTMIERRIEEYSNSKKKAQLPSVNRSGGVGNLAGDSKDTLTGSGGGFLDNF